MLQTETSNQTVSLSSYADRPGLIRDWPPSRCLSGGDLYGSVLDRKTPPEVGLAGQTPHFVLLELLLSCVLTRACVGCVQFGRTSRPVCSPPADTAGRDLHCLVPLAMDSVHKLHRHGLSRSLLPALSCVQTALLHLLDMGWEPGDLAFFVDIQLPDLLMKMTQENISVHDSVIR